MGAMAAIPIIGGLFSAGGSLAQSWDEKNQLEDLAATEEKNAVIARARGKYDAQKQDIMAGQRIGESIAGYGASGIKQDSGSVLEVLRASHINAEMDRLNILHGAELNAINAENKASAAKFGAKRIDQTKYFKAFSSFFGASSNSLANMSSGPSNKPQMRDVGSGGYYGSAGNSAGQSYTDTGSMA